VAHQPSELRRTFAESAILEGCLDHSSSNPFG
jgi:hypothetical protein